MLEAVPVAGAYIFGEQWPRLVRASGLPNDLTKAVAAMHAEFGDSALEDGEA